MLRSLKRLVQRQEGQSMTEYGLILALVAILAVVAVMAVGNKLSDVFNRIACWLGSGANC